MTRSRMREHIFKIIFRAEFHPEEDLREQLDLYMEQLAQEPEEEQLYIRNKAEAVFDKQMALDEQIKKVATGWRLERMGKAELAILRLACYEIQYDDDIPAGVAINEAVELAKRYGTEQSGGFVNAILARVV